MLILGVSVFAQNHSIKEAKMSRGPIWDQSVIDKEPATPIKPFVIPGAKSPQEIPISSSANIYTLIVESSTCLSANQDLGLVMFTSRANPTTGLGTSSGNIINSISTTFGQTWKHIIATGDSKSNRYPSGVIYNPTGNTNVNNAYSVICGPTTDGTAWIENYWGSVKLDSTNHNVVYEDYSVFSQDFPRYGLTATSDGKIHVLGDQYFFTDNVGITTFDYLVMNNGTFNSTSNKFDWNRVKIYNTFAKLGSDSTIEVSSWNTAWSPDGNFGYVWALGIDSANPNTSYQPIVFKSIDKGATWSKLPFFSFADIPVIYDNIYPVNSDTSGLVRRPYFLENDGVVDNTGNLHLFALIYGALTTHHDSLSWFRYREHVLFHLYTKPSGGWDADSISNFYTNYVPAANSPITGLGWDHRTQASRTADGTKIFAVWTDTDSTASNINLYPNLTVWGKDLVNNTTYPITDFTTGTTLEGTCYFHFASDIALVKGTDIVIPVTFATTGAAPEDPVSHYYLTSIGFGPSIGINAIDKSADLSLAGCYPNPVSDIANVRISLGKAASTSIEVYNVTGQKVASVNYGLLSTGEHNLTLDVQNLNRGVYVFIVKAGNETASGKIIRQ
jgi:hypothetical protein